MEVPYAFGLSSRRSGPGELILVLYGGSRWSFWRPPLLSEPGVSFVPRSIRFLGLLFLTLRHESTLVVEHRILGFLCEADLWYCTKTLAYLRGVTREDR